MTARGKFLLAGAGLFTFINFGGGAYAAALGESMHAGLHAALTLLGAYLMWRLAPAQYANKIRRRDDAAISGVSGAMANRLTELEQSVDIVAIEVERIGEGQRFISQLLDADCAARAAGEGAAESIKKQPGESAPTAAPET